MAEWAAYDAVEPIGAMRGDLRAAMQMALFANANRDPKKGKSFKPEDFLPFKPEPPPAPPGALRNDLVARFRAMNGKGGVTVTQAKRGP